MVALSLELLKGFEKFVCRDLRDRPVPDCRIQKIPEPPRLLEGRWCLGETSRYNPLPSATL
jgi:hypothetical protein